MLNVCALLEEELVERERARTWDGTRLHVSDLWYADEGCARQLKLRLTQAERRADTLGEHLMWSAGRRTQDDTGELIARGLEARDCLFIEERQVSLDEITGSADFVVVTPDDETVVIEHKTQRGFAFARMDTEGPRSQHILQLLGYMKALDARYGILFYRDRDGSNRPREYVVYRDDEAVDVAINLIRGIRDRDDLPPILQVEIVNRKPKASREYELLQESEGATQYVQNPWQCEYCPYHKISCMGALGEWRKMLSEEKADAQRDDQRASDATG